MLRRTRTPSQGGNANIRAAVNIKDNKDTLRIDLGFYIGIPMMAPSEVHVEVPCPFSLTRSMSCRFVG